jgi:hypothetical protein
VYQEREMIFQDLRNFIRFCKCNSITSDDQEWSGDEDHAPVHCGRGPVAFTTTPSDETNARTEIKTVAMAYMVKRILRERDFALMEGRSPSFYTCGKGASGKPNRRIDEWGTSASEAHRVYTCGIGADECLFPL